MCIIIIIIIIYVIFVRLRIKEVFFITHII